MLRESRLTGRASGTAVLEARPVSGVDETAPMFVFMHGGGTASKERFAMLMGCLADRGWRSVAFDFYGHGASSGVLAQQSLRLRESQARHVVDEVTDGPVVLVGFSMSGHTVTDLVARPPEAPVAAVVLGAPAAYDASAHDLRFGGGFTAAIRGAGSWRSTDAFAQLAMHCGPAALVLPGHDDVIPLEVTDAYCSAVASLHGEILRLPGAGHRLGTWLAEDVADRGRVVRLLDDVVAQVGP